MNVSEEKFLYLKNEWNRVNDSFKKKVIYRVGESQGFYSEINCMLSCMLWCYNRRIKFTIYADGANFSRGGGTAGKNFLSLFAKKIMIKETSM